MGLGYADYFLDCMSNPSSPPEDASSLLSNKRAPPLGGQHAIPPRSPVRRGLRGTFPKNNPNQNSNSNDNRNSKFLSPLH